MLCLTVNNYLIYLKPGGASVCVCRVTSAREKTCAAYTKVCMCVCVCSTCILGLVFSMCIIRTFPLHGVARFIISSHILMSQCFKIGPISLSNLVNLAFLFAPQGFQPLEITLTLLPFDGSIEWGRKEEERRGSYRAGWGDGGGGGGRSRRGSYRPFDIIMVHYSSEGSQRATASYTRGQTEYHLALIEASVLWAAALSLP